MSALTLNVENNICAGCLSLGRRLSPLTGAAAEFFQQIVEAAGGCTDAVVCWECTARVYGVLRFRYAVEKAVKILSTNKNTDINNTASLSRLSRETVDGTINILHDEAIRERSPVFVKMEDDDLDTFINEDVDIVEHEIKPVLKSESIKRKNKIRMSKKKEGDEFDASDEEPLASKTITKSKIKDKSKLKKAKRGRGRREQSAGVVVNDRVTSRLARLGLPPGALDMVVLSWDEVEAERQRMLNSENYLRHEHRCSYCAVGFNHRLKLAQHMNKHSPSAGAYECSVCSVRSRAPHALAAHRRRHRVRWRCSECGALWSRAAVAADHLRRAHPAPLAAPAAPAHRCPHAHCDHRAPTLSKLRAHMKTHATNQSCPDCGKTFSDRASLRTHLFSHRADKEHVCEDCGAKFLYPRALRLHRLTHNPPAPLYCHQCDVAFKNPMSYYQHNKYNLQHVHPDKLKHSCSYCGARFVRAARLAEHVAARHTRAYTHACTHHHCTYKSASRAVLRAHVRSVHGGGGRARMLVCHACGKTYTTKKSLESHLRSHSNNGPALPAARAPYAHTPTDSTKAETAKYTADI